MGKDSQISWTDHTYNPWQGCHPVSAGCAHCYMFREKKRYGQDPATVVRSSAQTFNAPLKWKEPALVFTCSWSDFFIEEADEWRDEVWDIIRRTPHLTYQILTKRPERIRECLPPDWGKGYPNVWLGVTIENSDNMRRVMKLFTVPAALYWVSYEPGLGPVDFTVIKHIDVGGEWEINALTGETVYLDPESPDRYPAGNPRLGWVVCAGESGKDGRPMHPDWLRKVRDNCQAAGVPFFFKGWGKGPAIGALLDGRKYEEKPQIIMRQKNILV